MGNFEFTGQYQQVNILTPIDAAYDNSETGSSNIHMNRGTAPIEILACNQSGSNLELLNRFELSGDDSTQYRYRTITTNVRQNLKIDSEGYLYFDTGFGELQYFTVQLGDGGTVRPGDDIQLRFQLLNYPEHSATVSEGDFLAVYDKPLLDAAKACINPNIADWTHFGPGGGTVTNSIPYGYGGTDGPAEFNAKMEEQKKAIIAYYADGKNDKIGMNPEPTEHPEWSPWNNTLAPGGSWLNYIGTNTTALPSTTIYPDMKIDDIQYYPYRPGLTTYNLYYTAEKSYKWDQIKYSAGVDCVGFVQRAASYDGNNYRLPDFVMDTWTRVVNKRKDTHDAEDIGHENYSWLMDDPDLLVPGDILYLPQPTGDTTRGARHVAIVLSVGFGENSRVLNRSFISVIEATCGPKDQWRILDSNTWNSLKNSDLYNPRRLVINN